MSYWDWQWQFKGDGGALTGRGFKLAVTVQMVQPVAEIHQSIAIGHPGEIKAVSVIGDRNPKPIFEHAHAKADLTGVAVPDGIVEGLLDREKEMVAHLPGYYLIGKRIWNLHPARHLQ